jgi:hypothetical protein
MPPAGLSFTHPFSDKTYLATGFALASFDWHSSLPFGATSLTT